jgi:NTP pyrophosphatase (non-canonical NTP hydrolase)
MNPNMTALEYTEVVKSRCSDKPEKEISDHSQMIVFYALGLAGEAGEVADLVKKAIFHNHGLDVTKLKKELGDVLWYITALCLKTGLGLDEVMQANADKVRLRYPDGFNSEDSKKRVDIVT